MTGGQFSVGLRLNTTVRPRSDMVVKTSLDTAVKTTQKIALHASTEVLCSASHAVVDQLMERLLALGEVVIDGLPDDIDPGESECDDIVDAEIDFRDDDEERMEPDPNQVFDDGQSPFRQGLYELYVAMGEDGRFTCEPSDDGWGVARGVTAFGKVALRRLDGRRNCYQAIAKWVEGRLARQEVDDPIRKLLGDGASETQKAFLADRSDGELEGVDAATFSRYVEGAELSWGDESVPVRVLFR